MQTRADREARLARIKQIQAQTDTANISSSAHVAALGISATGMVAVKNFLDSIADIFKTESLAEPILPFLKFSYWQSFFLQWISPAALLLSWKNTYDAGKRFFQAENRNWIRYLDLTVSFATALVSTLLFCLGGVKIGLFLALGMFAANAAYGLFNTAKNLGHAIFAATALERSEYLKQAGKQFISIFTNSFAFAVNFLIGIKLPDTSAINETFKLANQFLTGLSITAIAGIAANYAENTLKTLKNLFSNPRETWREIKSEFVQHPIRSIVTLPLKIITLPAQLLLVGIFKVAKLVLNRARPIASNKADTVAENKEEPATQKRNEKYHALVARVSGQIQEYSAKYPTEIEDLMHLMTYAQNGNYSMIFLAKS